MKGLYTEKVTENDFARIKEKAKNFPYTSMEYTDYEDVPGYEILREDETVILLGGKNQEAGCYEFHWAATTAEQLIKEICKINKQGDLQKSSYLLTFAPKEWIKTLEEAGFYVRNAWHDYFVQDLPATAKRLGIPAFSELDCEFLTLDECEKASELTQRCRFQSRGFTGQTKKWFENWISKENEAAENTAVIVHRMTDGNIAGILCTGTYGGNGTAKIVWVRELAVAPQYQNQGIAKKLLQKAFAYGLEKGAVKAFLAADEQNHVAIHRYESMGFVAADGDSQIDMVLC